MNLDAFTFIYEFALAETINNRLSNLCSNENEPVRCLGVTSFYRLVNYKHFQNIGPCTERHLLRQQLHRTMKVASQSVLRVIARTQLGTGLTSGQTH